MHYKNGREAKLGDPVVAKTTNGDKVYAGVLLDLVPAAFACNAQVCYPKCGGVGYLCVTVGAECLHADDAWIACGGDE